MSSENSGAPPAGEYIRIVAGTLRDDKPGIAEQLDRDAVRLVFLESTVSEQAAEIERLREALLRIGALDEAMGHELTVTHAFEAVGIAHEALGEDAEIQVLDWYMRAALQGEKNDAN